MKRSLLLALLASSALTTIEAEALLGTVPFLCVYSLSASAGGIASMASDASKLAVTSSDGLMVSLF